MFKLRKKSASITAYKKDLVNNVVINKRFSIVHDKNGIIRTEGLPEMFGVFNVELKNCDLVSDEIAKEIIKESVDYCTSEGFKFESPSIYRKDESGWYTWYVITKNNDEYVYRIILPDENNLAPWDLGCQTKFRYQFTKEDKKNNDHYKNFIKYNNKKEA